MKDLRQWLAKVEELGELKTLKGIPWDMDMGVIYEVVGRYMDKPAIMFDEAPGHPPGFRVLVNALGSRNRFATALGLPLGLSLIEMVQEWRRRFPKLTPIPPRLVDSGPVMENTAFGEEVNVLQFPTPKWHEKDGGRYIGTADAIITPSPEGDWVNVGTYRIQLFDRNHVGLMIVPAHHGAQHMEGWFAQGKPMPIAIAAGIDPVLFLVASREFPPGVNEYEWAGAIQGEPVEVIKGPITGLPIPAGAEIVLEGFVDPEDRRLEGPFGEYTGYYAGGMRPQPTVRVEGLYYRNNPIILGDPPLQPPWGEQFSRWVMQCGILWNTLEAAGVPDVTAAWMHSLGSSFTVIAVRQRYPGHAKQTARVAAQSYVGGMIGRFTVVVDEDIDVTDIDEVLWAMCTRVDPDKDIEILRGCTSSALDPIVHPDRKAFPTASRVLIDATRPYEWRDRFPEVVASSPELRQQVLARWGEKLKGII